MLSSTIEGTPLTLHFPSHPMLSSTIEGTPLTLHFPSHPMLSSTIEGTPLTLHFPPELTIVHVDPKGLSKSIHCSYDTRNRRLSTSALTIQELKRPSRPASACHPIQHAHGTPVPSLTDTPSPPSHHSLFTITHHSSSFPPLPFPPPLFSSSHLEGNQLSGELPSFLYMFFIATAENNYFTAAAEDYPFNETDDSVPDIYQDYHSVCLFHHNCLEDISYWCSPGPKQSRAGRNQRCASECRAFCGAQPLTPPCSGHGVCSFEPDPNHNMTACDDDEDKLPPHYCEPEGHCDCDEGYTPGPAAGTCVPHASLLTTGGAEGAGGAAAAAAGVPALGGILTPFLTPSLPPATAAVGMAFFLTCCSARILPRTCFSAFIKHDRAPAFSSFSSASAAAVTHALAPTCSSFSSASAAAGTHAHAPTCSSFSASAAAGTHAHAPTFSPFSSASAAAGTHAHASPFSFFPFVSGLWLRWILLLSAVACWGPSDSDSFSAPPREPLFARLLPPIAFPYSQANNPGIALLASSFPAAAGPLSHETLSVLPACSSALLSFQGNILPIFPPFVSIHGVPAYHSLPLPRSLCHTRAFPPVACAACHLSSSLLITPSPLLPPLLPLKGLSFTASPSSACSSVPMILSSSSFVTSRVLPWGHLSPAVLFLTPSPVYLSLLPPPCLSDRFLHQPRSRAWVIFYSFPARSRIRTRDVLRRTLTAVNMSFPLLRPLSCRRALHAPPLAGVLISFSPLLWRAIHSRLHVSPPLFVMAGSWRALSLLAFTAPRVTSAQPAWRAVCIRAPAAPCAILRHFAYRTICIRAPAAPRTTPAHFASRTICIHAPAAPRTSLAHLHWRAICRHVLVAPRATLAHLVRRTICFHYTSAFFVSISAIASQIVLFRIRPFFSAAPRAIPTHFVFVRRTSCIRVAMAPFATPICFVRRTSCIRVAMTPFATPICFVRHTSCISAAMPPFVTPIRFVRRASCIRALAAPRASLAPVVRRAICRRVLATPHAASAYPSQRATCPCVLTPFVAFFSRDSFIPSVPRNWDIFRALLAVNLVCRLLRVQFVGILMIPSTRAPLASC
ncbi:unnamed protein product [Closterium sp. Naga37s-1]|nr:unnamed protein product [Closterium sp. Naga37s-1]